MSLKRQQELSFAPEAFLRTAVRHQQPAPQPADTNARRAPAIRFLFIDAFVTFPEQI
jgi:hypothetical protein